MVGTALGVALVVGGFKVVAACAINPHLQTYLADIFCIAR